MKHVIAALPVQELPPGHPVRLEFVHENRPHSLLAVRLKGVVYAYLNVCPHWGVPLGNPREVLLQRGAASLVCSTHGAQFRLEDGVCAHGPCKGDVLEAIPGCSAMGYHFFFLPHSMRKGPG